MKKFLIGLVTLVFVITMGWIIQGPTPVISQTPDGETPAEESVCNGLSGAAYGLCTAYCEAMDCENGDAEASDAACDKVFNNYVRITGGEPPCAGEPSCGNSAPQCGGECPASQTCSVVARSCDIGTGICIVTCGCNPER